ncbi:lipid II flippase Amj family protein [Paenibacillus sp. GD4]|jgi:hypothetical protein|uniref:lipid II flippase Amj family protein n=1 Tax=Paenibacillus TaxID=44249 RepID=UPI002542E5AB|nr:MULTISPECIES: lipid II flippase Amj family protein [Paenibacillus]MDQ1910337.1 lipid II flippase Amj family protein [Paenibacillus sp. GD4]
MTGQLLIICCLTAVIHLAETLGYAVRLAGVRAGKLAVALSITGIILIVARTSNMLQGALSGSIIDDAKAGIGMDLRTQLHFIIGSASVGTILAILLFPTAVFISMRLVAHLEAAGSMPQMLHGVTVRKLRHVQAHLRRPRLEMLSRLRIGGIPKRLLLLNTLVSGIYTVGVLAALYASYLVPASATAASQSSGLINGIATILLTLLIDPQVALLTDRALSDPSHLTEMNKMFGLLMLSRLLGTLLAQVLLLPGAYLIVWAVGWL